MFLFYIYIYIIQLCNYSIYFLSRSDLKVWDQGFLSLLQEMGEIFQIFLIIGKNAVWGVEFLWLDSLFVGYTHV